MTKKDLTQWFFRITDYAQRLLDDLATIDWPEKIKLMQTNWIGRSEGAEVEFALPGRDDTLTVASICFVSIQQRSSAINPYSPNATVLPRVARPTCSSRW